MAAYTISTFTVLSSEQLGTYTSTQKSRAWVGMDNSKLPLDQYLIQTDFAGVNLSQNDAPTSVSIGVVGGAGGLPLTVNVARPSFAGQTLTFYRNDQGLIGRGSVVCSFLAPIDFANSTFTLANEGECFGVIGVYTGSSLVYKLTFAHLFSP